MTLEQHLQAEAALFDLQCLGEMVAQLSLFARQDGTADLPATWMGVIGRTVSSLARDAGDALGDIPSRED